MTDLEKLEQKYKDMGVELVILNRAGEIELGIIRVPKDKQREGIGTSFMEELIELADRERKIVVTSPSSNFGSSKGRLLKFYKRFGFLSNKGRNADMRFRATMIRYPFGKTLSQHLKSLNEAEDTDQSTGDVVPAGTNAVVPAGTNEIETIDVSNVSEYHSFFKFFEEFAKKASLVRAGLEKYGNFDTLWKEITDNQRKDISTFYTIMLQDGEKMFMKAAAKTREIIDSLNESRQYEGKSMLLEERGDRLTKYLDDFAKFKGETEVKELFDDFNDDGHIFRSTAKPFSQFLADFKEYSEKISKQILNDIKNAEKVIEADARPPEIENSDEENPAEEEPPTNVNEMAKKLYESIMTLTVTEENIEAGKKADTSVNEINHVIGLLNNFIDAVTPDEEDNNE